MNPNWITVSLFHGDAGWIVGALALWGGIRIVTAVQDWVTDRYAFDFNWLRVAIGPSGRKIGSGWFGWDLWIGVPRRLKVHRRWDRPGAMVGLGDGREGAVLWTAIDLDAGGIAIVQPYVDELQQQPEWVPLERLSPLPRYVTASAPASDA